MSLTIIIDLLLDSYSQTYLFKAYIYITITDPEKTALQKTHNPALELRILLRYSKGPLNYDYR